MPATPQRPTHIVHLLYRFAPGQPFTLYPAMYRLLRRLKPDVFHRCNAQHVVDPAESLHLKKYIQNHLLAHTK